MIYLGRFFLSFSVPPFKGCLKFCLNQTHLSLFKYVKPCQICTLASGLDLIGDDYVSVERKESDKLLRNDNYKESLHFYPL